MQPVLITDFDDESLFYAIKKYCAEMDIQIFRYPILLNRLAREKARILAFRKEGRILSFVIFNIQTMKSDFFEETICFVREVWTRQEYRHRSLATQLLLCLELYCFEIGVCHLILTSRTAGNFYESLGYKMNPYIHAQNQLPVYEKFLK